MKMQNVTKLNLIIGIIIYSALILYCSEDSPVEPENVVSDDYSPAWSPDGSKIAFQSNRDGNWEIYTMNADGSNQTNISNNDFDDGSPSWSPDGSKIAFNTVRDGNCRNLSVL